MDRPIFIDKVLGSSFASMREIMEIVKCAPTAHLRAAVHAHLEPRRGRVLKERIEGTARKSSSPAKAGRAILNKLVEAEGYEKFLHQVHGHQALRP